MTEATIETPTKDHTSLPAGDWCIVEQMGHTTMVGRYAEVERFGTKMMGLEPLFNGTLLPVIYLGGQTIYRMTPCTAEVAWTRQPKHSYQIPSTLAATIPAALLDGPTEARAPWPGHEDEDDTDGDGFPIRD